ncbi:MAG: MipA/OmpV family protein [Pseudomonadales bacterium]|nr:MipA/OmpV family protein [Pseudomonadales bacterium]
MIRSISFLAPTFQPTLSLIRPRLLQLPLLIMLAAYQLTLSADELNTTMDTSSEGEFQIQVGGGIGASDLPWKGIDINPTSMPYFDIAWGNWHFGFKHGLAAYTIGSDRLQASLGVNYRDETYDTIFDKEEDLSKDRVFDGYESGDGELTAKLSAKLYFIGLDVEQDVTDQSGGLTASAMLEYPVLELGPGTKLIASAGARWLDEKYVHHLYGIEGDNINPAFGRTAYQGEAAINLVAGVTAIYSITDNWTVIGVYQFQKLDDVIQDSPLVGQAFQQDIKVFVSYRLDTLPF